MMTASASLPGQDIGADLAPLFQLLHVLLEDLERFPRPPLICKLFVQSAHLPILGVDVLLDLQNLEETWELRVGDAGAGLEGLYTIGETRTRACWKRQLMSGKHHDFRKGKGLRELTRVYSTGDFDAPPESVCSNCCCRTCRETYLHLEEAII